MIFLECFQNPGIAGKRDFLLLQYKNFENAMYFYRWWIEISLLFPKKNFFRNCIFKSVFSKCFFSRKVFSESVFFRKASFSQIIFLKVL